MADDKFKRKVRQDRYLATIGIDEYRKRSRENTRRYRERHREKLNVKAAEDERRKRADPVLNAKIREQVRARNIRNQYGISASEYDARLAAQGGLCAICGKEIKRLAFDHCHKTGKLREFLCQSHNAAIGLFGDDPALVLAAYEYLLKHQEADT